MNDETNKTNTKPRIKRAQNVAKFGVKNEALTAELYELLFTLRKGKDSLLENPGCHPHALLIDPINKLEKILGL